MTRQWAVVSVVLQSRVRGGGSKWCSDAGERMRDGKWRAYRNALPCMFARPSAVLSASIALQLRIAYKSLACAASLDVYFGHSKEKKQVCATGKWPFGRRVSSRWIFIDWGSKW